MSGGWEVVHSPPQLRGDCHDIRQIVLINESRKDDDDDDDDDVVSGSKRTIDEEYHET